MAGNSASSYSEMDGIQKAAILLITLGPEKAAVVFKHLKEDEIEQTGEEIAVRIFFRQDEKNCGFLLTETLCVNFGIEA